MGEVYRALDLRLGRQVALKFLPDSLAGDEGRLLRFEREARLLAALNHPGIATLYGFEHADRSPFLVLEVVEGSTLAERIARGRMPWREAAEMGRQIAEALQTAHEHGIVHRDLKPANVKVSPDGRVKLIDFGLGKALAARSAASEVKLATETSPSSVGVILGTAPYMSPEQTRGETVDERTDIWAFGCVLYEMLTGTRAFPGPTASDVVAAILERQPDWTALPLDVPYSIRSLLRRCLAKEPFRRLHAIADARIELEEPMAELERAASERTASWQFPVATLTVMSALALGAFAVQRWRSVPLPALQVPTRFNIAPASGTELQFADAGLPMIALSPDGRTLVYQAHPVGSPVRSGYTTIARAPGALYRRSWDRAEARPMQGTERASHPFFSPDGRWIGFHAANKLQKLSVEGGAPRSIADVSDANGASWGEDGSIVYAPSSSAGLYRVADEGGVPERLTQPDGQLERSHSWPQILPGGRAVLFTINPPSGRVVDSSVAVLSLETGHRKVIIQGGVYGRYLPTGHIVHASQGTLYAAPFDLREQTVTGPSVPVLEDIRMDELSGLGGAQIAFSETGVLAYVTPRLRPRLLQLLLIDRQGNAVPLSPMRRAFDDPMLSPDGRRVVVGIHEPDGATNLWVYDRGRQIWTQLTFEGNNWLPQWSPRGDRLAFASNREGFQNLFVMPGDGGAPVRLSSSRYAQLATGWSPDGRSVLFAELNPHTSWDVWEVAVDGERPPRPLVVLPGYQGGGRVSPDGRWLAYRSSETGQAEVHVRPYSSVSGERWPISTDGGRLPRWSSDGREIFYISERSGGYKIWAVPVTTHPTFRPGQGRVLFERTKDSYSNFDVTSDGRYFLVAEDVEPVPERLDIVLVPNWFEELKARVPAPN